jgi:Fur family transcriptional regulator, ferric uptake regulator
MTERRKAPVDAAVEERALSRFRDMLKEKALNFSTVREAIARAAFRFPGHFDVADLVLVLKRAGVRGAHRTTVYRTVPLLLEAGIIQPALLSASDRQLYEPAFEREHHDHLVCTACGKVVEFHFEAFEVLQRDLAARYGFELVSHVHELLGRCSACKTAGRIARPSFSTASAQQVPARRASESKPRTTRATRP